MNIVSAPISSSNPVLTCQVNEQNIIVNETQLFNVTVSLIDSVSSQIVPNIAWQNYTWSATLKLISMSSCNSKGALLSSASSVIFDTSTGIASFQSLKISQKGMYMLSIEVKTTNVNDYDFTCMSKPVLVKGTTETILTNDATIEPDMYLTFSGNYTSLSAQTLSTLQTMIYNCILINNGLLIQSAITLYQGSIIAALGTSGGASSYTSMVTALNSSNLTLGSGIVLQSAQINGKSYAFNTQANTNNNNQVAATAQSNDDTNAVNQLTYHKKFVWVRVWATFKSLVLYWW